MRILTLAQLTEAGACEEEIELFTRHFGKSVAVTEELATTLSDTFSFRWAGLNLLSRAAQIEFDEARDPAGAEHTNASADAYTKYSKVRAAACAEHDKFCAASRAKYDKVCKAAWGEYLKASKPSRDKYDKVCAVAFARLYNADQT